MFVPVFVDVVDVDILYPFWYMIAWVDLEWMAGGPDFPMEITSCYTYP